MIRQISLNRKSNPYPIVSLIKQEIPAKRIKLPVIFGLKIVILSVIFLVTTSYQSPNSPFRDKALELYLTPFKTDMQAQLEKFKDNDTRTIETSEVNTETLSGQFYKQAGYLPRWTLNFMPTDNSKAVVQLFENAKIYGLNPDDYQVKKIKKLENELSSDNDLNKKIRIRQEYELLLTESSFNFMIHLNRGWNSVDTSAAFRNYSNSLPSKLNNAIRNNSIKNDILALQPNNFEYVLLQRALAKFLKTVPLENENVTIPSPQKDSALCYKLTEAKLSGLGLFNPTESDNDSAFILSLRQFQKLNGLEPDGKIGRKTRKALEKSSKYRYEQIALNLDRLRKEYNLSTHYAYINIPAFELKLVKNNIPEKSFRVIVGKPGTPTPELSSRIEKIITHPYWIVPKSIAVNEILPKLKQDSTYLEKHRFNLIDRDKNNISYADIDWNDVDAGDFNYVFRQDASNSNALGEIKFIFPNKYSVYLHDTPSKRLFQKNVRAFSHGCIRLENPESFAEYLARENVLDQQDDSISKLLKDGVREEIDLRKPLDVYIRYLTCAADDQLNLYFYDDIYNKDKDMIDSLFN